MARPNSQEIKLPTKASSSLRSKTVGRLSVFGGKQSPNAPKSQTWNKNTPGIPEASIRTVPRPNLTWEPGMFTVDYILRNLPLPRVIQCDHTHCDLGKGMMGFDCRELLMFNCKSDSLKVQAGSLAVSTKDGKSLVETENRLQVPEEYKGWFAVLGTEMTLKVIPHYRNVAQLAQSDCHTFLIGGTENVRAVQKVGESFVDSRHLCPGDTLKMGTLDETENYLHCTDENDRDVLIPIGGQGMFYVMKNKTHPCKVPILQIKDILQRYKFPCIVKLVFGREPTGEGVFTKILTLEGVQQETSVLASTVLKGKNTLHELSLDTPNTFKIAVRTKDLVHNVGYISALNLCQDKGDLFLRSIKMYRQNPGSVEGRVSAMGITFASPVTSKTSPGPTKELTRSVSQPPKLTHETAKAKISVSPSVQHGTSVKASVSSSTTTTAVSKPIDLRSGGGNKSTVSPHMKVNRTLDTTSNAALSTQEEKSKENPSKTNGTVTIASDKPKMLEQKVQLEAHQNGVKQTETASTHQRRQRAPDQRSTLPLPPTIITLDDDISESVQNGVKETDKPVHSHHVATVQVVQLGKPAKPKSVRPNVYEEVWTATSVKDDSDLSSETSSLSDSYIQSGIGGQLVTGGMPPAPTPAAKPAPTPTFAPAPAPDVVDPKTREQNIRTINVVPTNAKKKLNLLAHYSTIDVVDGKPVIKDNEHKMSQNSYSTIDIVDDDPVEEDDTTDSEELRTRKKKVSFSDILDVQTIPETHVTTINIQEKTKKGKPRREEERNRSAVNKFHASGSDSYLSGSPSDTSTRPPAAFIATGENSFVEDMSRSSSAVDEEGYMLPTLDRKGRVKLGKDSHKVHSDRGNSHADFARKLSLPNMTITDAETDPRTYRRRTSEADILW